MRHRCQQLLCVWLLCPVEDAVGIALLDNLPVLHHHDAIGHIGDDTHIVGDQDDAGLDAMPQITHEIKDFGLHRHIQRGGGLIGNEQPGIQGQCLRDHRALTLPTGKLMGVMLDPLLGLGHVHQLQ